MTGHRLQETQPSAEIPHPLAPLFGSGTLESNITSVRPRHAMFAHIPLLLQPAIDLIRHICVSVRRPVPAKLRRRVRDVEVLDLVGLHEYLREETAGRVPRDVALAWIAAADVLLSASRDEGAPSVVREARTLGTRVVAVAAGDLREWSRFDPGLTVIPELTALG